ncbi:hypothetical protein O6H91_23G020900 [Diphasiastrum complanatum]|uniref:Uncharacterized protein n=1 Tax=Diphasiastrum complanatum TaxID=34168 RepID=A0ACC2A8V7_DIPCM|nr:hypothetical protein O6H91_23G020900 [Diphasiastrum complanatum]
MIVSLMMSFWFYHRLFVAVLMICFECLIFPLFLRYKTHGFFFVSKTIVFFIFKVLVLISFPFLPFLVFLLVFFLDCSTSSPCCSLFDFALLCWLRALFSQLPLHLWLALCSSECLAPAFLCLLYL